MDATLEQLREFAANELPNLVIPIAVLVVGFVVAVIASALVRRGLRRTNLDERLATRMLGEERAGAIHTERWASRIVYYVILLFTAIAFLQVTQLTAATEPLNSLLASLLAFVPNLIGAAAIALVAWLVATATRTVLARAFDRWEVDRRVRVEIEQEAAAVETEEDEESPPRRPAVGRAVAEAAYWLVWLLFTPALLDAFELDGLLVPVQEMLNEALGFLPNIASAALIVGVGWLVARIVQRLVANALAGVGTDRLSERVKLSEVLGEQTLSSLIGLVVYVLILIPVAIGALAALQLEALTAPASDMLQRLFAAVPAIFGAALVIGVAYFAARLLYSVVRRLLNGLGFDSVLGKIGMTQEQLGERTPSRLIAGLVLVAVLYFAAVEAAQLLGFATFAGVAREFAVLAGHILLGLVVFGLGLYLSKLAADAIERSSVSQASVLGPATRAAVLALAGAMALRQMGIADEIIELAFGLVLGAIAIAAALAFGLGGREAASKAIEDIRERLHEKSATSPAGGGSDGGSSRRSEPPADVPAPAGGLADPHPTSASRGAEPPPPAE